MLKTEERTIEGLRFRIVQLPGRRSDSLLLLVMGLFAPAIGKALGGLGGAPTKAGAGFGSLKNSDLDFAKMGEALPAFFASLTPSKLDELRNEILATVQHINSAGNATDVLEGYDAIFAGHPFASMKLMIAVLEVNYGNFSAGFASTVKRYFAAMAPPMETPAKSSSPNGSGASGTSGGSG